MRRVRRSALRSITARNLRAVVVVVDRTVQQRFRVPADGGQWRAQFVGHVGDEVAPHGFEPLQFGDVVEYQPRTPAGRHHPGQGRR